MRPILSPLSSDLPAVEPRYYLSIPSSWSRVEAFETRMRPFNIAIVFFGRGGERLLLSTAYVLPRYDPKDPETTGSSLVIPDPQSTI